VALAADQQAMLQLLLERGQSYEDLASVLGADQAGVRERARAALTELAGVDPDRNVGLTDYLLGQADPIGRADAVRHLKDDPADLALATELSQKLRLLAPQADLPRLPGEERRPKPRAEGGAAARLPIRDRLRMGRTASPDSAGGGGPPIAAGARGHRTRMIVALGCLVVLLVVGILAVAGAFSGSDDSGKSPTGSAKLAKVPLAAPGGGTATGTAAFGTSSGTQLFVDVSLEGLKPAPPKQAYVMWLMLTSKQGYPVPSVLNVSSGGSFEDRITIPSPEVPLALRARSVDVSVAPATAIQASITSAVKNGRLVDKPGTTVLRGKIPAGSSGSKKGGSTGQPTTP
jgi:hypothetical protein